MSTQRLFSIIIPTYGRPDLLRRCLQSIIDSPFPKGDFEVIVVDDGSPEPIEELFENFDDRTNCCFLRQGNAGPATARNNGAEMAKGTYLVFIDDDCQLDEKYLVNLKGAFERSPNSVLTGSVINHLKDNIFSEASQLLIDYLHVTLREVDGNAGFLTSNNFALPKNLFNQIGGFDIRFSKAAAEDREIGLRLEHLGHPVIYSSDLVVRHSHDLDFFRFFKQHFNYGRGAYSFFKIRSEYHDVTARVHSFKFYSKMFRYPFEVKNKWPAIKITCLFLLSQIGTFLGYFFEKISQKSK